jgi:predicted ATPase
MARLDRMLAAPRTRLVTITGPGGTGKTRLALEAAARLVSDVEAQERALSGAVFVSLAELSEADRLFEVVLRALGLLPVADTAPLEQLVQALRAQPDTLLVLDNFEQLAEEGAIRVRDLLLKAVEVKLLVTSRQTLHLEGEHEFHLAPLPLSSGAQTSEELLSVASIALFVDRAQAALPDFQLTERNAATVAQLCDYLEGLPLAIELAAARVGFLTPARILSQVQADRLDFLATRRRDAVSRQKTLRATLDWSYRLLAEAGQRFLAQVSVFRGGWTLEAAQAICALSQGETLDWLTLLRDSSLIKVTDTEEGLRFTLLETIRELERCACNEAANVWTYPYQPGGRQWSAFGCLPDRKRAGSQGGSWGLRSRPRCAASGKHDDGKTIHPATLIRTQLSATGGGRRCRAVRRRGEARHPRRAPGRRPRSRPRRRTSRRCRAAGAGAARRVWRPCESLPGGAGQA